MVLFLNRLQRLIQTLLRLIGIRPQRRHSPESLGDRPAPRPPIRCTVPCHLPGNGWADDPPGGDPLNHARAAPRHLPSAV